MDLSLAHLKKVLKFGILLVGIQFAGLQSGLGKYTPSSLKGKEITWGYIFDDYFSSLCWKTTLTSYYGSEALAHQSIVPSSMLDSKGFFYALGHPSFANGHGARFCICKYDPQGSQITNKNLYFSPWYMVNSNINCLEEPHLNYVEGDQALFKNFIHNAYQPCIAQEVGEYSNYLYVFVYIPPLRFCLDRTRIEEILKRPPAGDDEGILLLKIDKESMKIVSQEFYSGTTNEIYKFDHQQPRRTNDNHAFNQEWGNFTAWAYKDDNTDRIHLSWITLRYPDDPDVWMFSEVFSWYNGQADSNYCTHTCSNFSHRFINYNKNVYFLWCDSNCPVIEQPSVTEVRQMGYNTSGLGIKPFEYMDHLSQRLNDYTSRNYDFCIVDNKDGSPIFCILGLRPTSETDNSKISLSGVTNERWTSKCNNESSKIVLILSSRADKANVDLVEDPQNIIYSTGKTTAESCTVDCGCYTNDKGDYKENQLFKNTHKLVAYTSESGSKYIIYCYCYPGKSKQLFLGYAPYIISNNKVQLLTKTEFKTPPSTDYPMGESFGYFTSCSRIISMDCKNGKLWITWMDADNKIYYRFHIAAKDLVGE